MRRAALLELALFTSGCGSLLAPVDSPAAFLIDPAPKELPQAARTHGGLLVVQAPICQPAYDTTRMAYRMHPHQVDYFARHEWAERPPRMLHPLIVRTLQATRCCTAIVAAPSRDIGDFSLRTGIVEIVQDFTAEPAQLRLALRVELNARQRLLATRDIVLAEPMAARNAEAGVTAANAATSRALRAIAQLAIEALA
jgi:cholesterol transport system auxiliary component